MMIGAAAARPRVVLADANSFFTSCETVFHPELIGRPIVVLSNNDGCVVARSSAAKRLSIVNGTPWYQIRRRAEQDGVVARSSNYELYASLSQRMMRVMGRFLPNQEVYSIDECFLTSWRDDERTATVCARMRQAVLQGVGIPVSIGVAPTKTLAKIANHWAKRHPVSSRGVTLWNRLERAYGNGVLSSVPVGEVWGVGHRLSRRLMGMGIVTALQLRDADPTLIRRRFSVLLERTALELRGVPCIPADTNADAGVRTTQILCSRMFSTPVTGRATMRQVLSVYAQKACARLHRQHGLCSRVAVFCSSSPFHALKYSRASGSSPLTDPSDNPLVIAKAACNALDRSPDFDPDARYVRAGVILLGLLDADDYHTLSGLGARRDDENLGTVLDRAAHRFGPFRIGIGYGGIRGQGRGDADTGASWTMRRAMLSPRCTTRWDELAIVHAH